jgi:hypothetical protein
MSSTKLLIIVLVILIVFIYTHYYSKHSTSYEITQTYLDKITLELLYEHNPIVIYDSIKTPNQLLKTLFNYSYTSKNEYKIKHQNVVMNRQKFSFIYSSNDTDCYVNLINPSYTKDFKWKKYDKTGDMISQTNIEDTNVEYITIKLKPFQVLIVPSHWLLQCTEQNTSLHKVNLHDVFSWIYFKIW